MINKKGFTLVELLATIILLTVVYGIAYSLYTNMINFSKDNVFRDNVRSVINNIRTIEVVEKGKTAGCLKDLETKGTTFYGYWKLENNEIVLYWATDLIRYSEEVHEDKMKEQFDVVRETIEDQCPEEYAIK